MVWPDRTRATQSCHQRKLKLGKHQAKWCHCPMGISVSCMPLGPGVPKRYTRANGQRGGMEKWETTKWTKWTVRLILHSPHHSPSAFKVAWPLTSCFPSFSFPSHLPLLPPLTLDLPVCRRDLLLQTDPLSPFSPYSLLSSLPALLVKNTSHTKLSL